MSPSPRLPITSRTLLALSSWSPQSQDNLPRWEVQKRHQQPHEVRTSLCHRQVDIAYHTRGNEYDPSMVNARTEKIGDRGIKRAEASVGGSKQM